MCPGFMNVISKFLKKVYSMVIDYSLLPITIRLRFGGESVKMQPIHSEFFFDSVVFLL